MSCLLRMCGASLDVDAMLRKSALKPERIWRKGEPRHMEEGHHRHSGANFIASDEEISRFSEQEREVMRFLERNMDAIQALVAFPGVEEAFLDFAVGFDEEPAMQCYGVSSELVQLAAAAGVGIKISVYACCE